MPPSTTAGIDIIKYWHSDMITKLHNYNMPLNNKISAYDTYLLKELESLKKLPVIIKPADKNLGTALLSPALYHELCMQHLNDTNTYRKLPSTTNLDDIAKDVFGDLETILDRHGMLYIPLDPSKRQRTTQRKLTPLALSLLQLKPKVTSPHGIPNNPNTQQPQSHQLRMANFYIIPKLHKKNISGRPIVNTINSYTYMTSIYLHRVLLLALPYLPTVVTSTHAALRRLLQLQLPGDAILLCADVKSLYPSIPIEYGLHAVQSILTQLQQQQHININISLTMALLRWTLTNNYLSYLDDIYLQLTGTAMGTPVAVMYANITLAYLESTATAYQPYLYMRYIDDLCVICKDSEQANNIVRTFNAQCSSITLEEVTIANKGVFLDLNIELYHQPYSTAINIQTFQKNINKYMYITPKSNHERTVLKNFIFNELCRYRLQCSNDTEYRKLVRLFNDRIRRRDYNSNYISSIYCRIPIRNQLLQRLYQPKLEQNKEVTVCTLHRAFSSFISSPKKFLSPNSTMLRHPVLNPITKSIIFNYYNDPNLLKHLCNDARTKTIVKNFLASSGNQT